MKVLQILMGAGEGGICSTVGYLHRRLTQRSHESAVICTPGYYGSAPTETKCVRQYGVELRPAHLLRREIAPVADVRALQELRTMIARERPDVVITRTSKGGMLGRAAAFLERVPVRIHFIHGFAFHSATPRLQFELYRRIEQGAAHLCHKLVSVNAEDRERAIHLGICPSRKIMTIENGVETERFRYSAEHREELRRELGIRPDEFVVTFASRLSPQKDYLGFVDAMQILEKRGFAVRGLVAGDGPGTAELRKYVDKTGAGSVVRLLGLRSDMPRVLSATDVFAGLSFWEGMPKNVLEAMANGRPLVVSDTKGTKEVVEHNTHGLVVPIGDALAAANAVQRLRDEPELCRDMTARNARVAHELYSADRMVERTIELAEQLLSSNGPRHV